MIGNLTQRLFSEQPTETLYHYTSLSGVLGIVDSGQLRASDIRFMNDSAELRHTLDLLRDQVTRRIVAGTDSPNLLNRLLQWLSHRMVSGPMLFGASFRANGNLLSQWWGYSAHGKGVSLGFNPGVILECARGQRFHVGRCIYDPGEQHQLIEKIVDSVEQTAGELSQQGPSTPADAVFEQVEEDLLRIAAILKHPAFEEEQEWRLISPAIRSPGNAAVNFREGSSMLVPYYAFGLVAPGRAGLSLDHVYLGPTGNRELSMTSLELYLTRNHARPAAGISYCDIPFRQR
jgi:hypothetical protein